MLLEDYHLVEKIANFHRERIPERIVHARGAGAKGYFEVTHDITHLTCADFLRGVGVQVQYPFPDRYLVLAVKTTAIALIAALEQISVFRERRSIDAVKIIQFHNNSNQLKPS